MLAHQGGIRRGSAFAMFCDGISADPISMPTTSAIRDTGPVNDFLRNIVPVVGIIRFPDGVVVNLSFPIKTIPELIAYAKANPGNVGRGGARWSSSRSRSRIDPQTRRDIP
jgi:tripartite-type tricarboxylate transporter receptor subunit TctC